jgi:glycerophosphoryl diester phosphodiesterase
MKNPVTLAFAILLTVTACGPAPQNSHYIDIPDRDALYAWFRYSPDRDIIVSGHRGGMEAGYPENCIESFEKTLGRIESFFEIDPRLTRDSVIVLMHDETIDRTTTGSGKVSDYTYEELKQFNLIDRDGNITPYKIPTLEECIRWSRGKTILNLDIKDVPHGFMSDFISSLGQPANVMYTVRNASQARLYLDRDPGAMLSCWCHSMAELDAYDEANVPWGQVMAYVGPRMKEDDGEMHRALRSRGVMCMISVAPTHDRAVADGEKVAGYIDDILTAPDVIETDFPRLFTELDLKKKPKNTEKKEIR